MDRFFYLPIVGLHTRQQHSYTSNYLDTNKRWQRKPFPKTLLWLLAGFSISACSHSGWLTTVGPDFQPVPITDSTTWQSPQPEPGALPLPHQGSAMGLQDWWAGFNDPVLTKLQQAAQQASASIATAQSRIVQARTSLIGADAALIPSLDGSLGLKRSSASFGGTPFVWNQYQVGVQSNWELDLFGGIARQIEAAQSQLESRQAAWHDARVAVAVEVANAYLAYRYCQIQQVLTQQEANSWQTSAQLSQIAVQHGFKPASEAALGQAQAADSQRKLLQQLNLCEHAIKGLVALSAISETELRLLLATNLDVLPQLPQPPVFSLAAIPAQVLLQRPDIAAAERDMAEASANIGVETAKQYPRLSLSGNITPTLQNINAGALMLAQTWSFGPTLSLPLFDAGKHRANVEQAQAQFEAVASTFRSKVRIAVKEVEEALLRHASVSQRLPQAELALTEYFSRLNTAEQAQQVGLGNRFDLEIARRAYLAAKQVKADLQQEQVSAWLALYRAAGGSWVEQPVAEIAIDNPQNRVANQQLAE